MKQRSGAIALIAIFLCLGLSQAVGSSDEGPYVDETWGQDYLNYALGGSLGRSGSSVAYGSSSGSGFIYSQYLQYYFTEEEVLTPDRGPAAFAITGNEPSVLNFGWQTLPYSEYIASGIYAGSNELWIEGEMAWTRYAACPVGTWLQIVVSTPAGGAADFYEISPSSGARVTQHAFGKYNRLGFFAGEVGRYVLFFVADNLPSNVVVIDVGPEWLPYAAPATSPTIPPMGTVAPEPRIPIPTSGDVSITIQSQRMRGYDVYLNDNYVGTDGQGGDALDGIFKLNVAGGQWHTIRVWDGEFNYVKPKFYERRSTHILQVEPGTAVYLFGGMG
ncbi:hypothetical protein [Candidatus Methanocrinis natronophilus]|uniref:PEGA domain-containing protein n=1 Tax=Candidatus Methanocrinis natronophilus TaxID=3033396 RepID=A0ABT5X754_9EURY|nr:hypothetical protein [Candidatus Methanocrinis natronophilus]MDF0590520.1 hypothetical protein [Candidatus Methanocrinis natronophilus]